MARPTTHLDWTDGAADKVAEPVAGKRAVGWLRREKPPFQWMNWLFWRQDVWNKYFDKAHRYQFTVGTGGTHATLAALFADAAWVAGSSAMIISDLALAATAVIDKANVEIFMRPGVTVSADGATTGIQVSASGARIHGGRMSGFTTAILIDAAVNHTMVRDVRFATCTADVSDLSSSSSILGNITE